MHEKLIRCSAEESMEIQKKKEKSVKDKGIICIMLITVGLVDNLLKGLNRNGSNWSFLFPLSQ